MIELIIGILLLCGYIDIIRSLRSIAQGMKDVSEAQTGLLEEIQKALTAWKESIDPVRIQASKDARVLLDH